jgi:alkanesulfonate monooxygenase SsuD/methylene tetrahydromethanopterin reductase-like flavin-dependent oxidoreductase (luciferase family)
VTGSASTRKLEFGYSPPPGDREMGPIDPATFVPDLDRVIDAVVPWASSIWISDHVMEHDRYRIESWTQLTWIAARHPGPLLGHCVLANSYRHPPLLAKMAASLQELSGGRFILGYGAGWLEPEYRGYGYDFPSARVRIEQLEEAIRLMKTLWAEQPANFEGRWYRLEEAWCNPRPDPPIPILVAGGGERYLLRVVAQHADWWLSYGDRPDVLRHKLAVLADHCRDVGRDMSTIRKATPLTVYLDRDRAKAKRWAGDATTAEQPAFAGDPAALRDHLAELAELGFDQVQLRFASLFETHDIELFADEVLPQFA